jgi:hypothetical protein
MLKQAVCFEGYLEVYSRDQGMWSLWKLHRVCCYVVFSARVGICRIIIYFLLFLVGWDWVHLVLRPLLAYSTSPRRYVTVIVELLVEWRLAGETEVLGEILPRATLSTSPTWPDPSSNLGHRGEKPATNRLRFGAACNAGYVWEMPIALRAGRTRSRGSTPGRTR